MGGAQDDLGEVEGAGGQGLRLGCGLSEPRGS